MDKFKFGDAWEQISAGRDQRGGSLTTAAQEPFVDNEHLSFQSGFHFDRLGYLCCRGPINVSDRSADQPIGKQTRKVLSVR